MIIAGGCESMAGAISAIPGVAVVIGMAREWMGGVGGIGSLGFG